MATWYKYSTNKGTFYGTWSPTSFAKSHPGTKVTGRATISESQAYSALKAAGYSTTQLKSWGLSAPAPAKKAAPKVAAPKPSTTTPVAPTGVVPPIQTSPTLATPSITQIAPPAPATPRLEDLAPKPITPTPPVTPNLPATPPSPALPGIVTPTPAPAPAGPTTPRSPLTVGPAEPPVPAPLEAPLAPLAPSTSPAGTPPVPGLTPISLGETPPSLAGYPSPTTAMDLANQQNITQASGQYEALNPYAQGVNEYVAALQRMQSPIDIYQGLANSQGLTQQSEAVKRLREETNKVSDLLGSLGEDIMSRTRGLDVSEAQRNRIQAFEQEPLAKQYGTYSTNLSRGEQALAETRGQVGSLAEYAIQGEKQKLQPYEANIEGLKYIGGVEMDAVSDRLAREQSGFSADREMQYNLVMDQLNRNRTLSDRDWEMARQLEAEEREYSRQKALLRLDASLNPPSSGGGGSLTAWQLAEIEANKKADAAAKRDKLFEVGRTLIPAYGWTSADGGKWGPAWNILKAQFPSFSNAEIDAALGIPGGFSAGPWR